MIKFTSRTGPSNGGLAFVLGLALVILSFGALADVSDALFKKGYQQLQAGAYAAAAQSFRTGLQTNPDDPLAHFYLGQAEWSLGQKVDAAKEFKDSLRLDANSTVSVKAKTRLEDLVRESLTVGTYEYRDERVSSRSRTLEDKTEVVYCSQSAATKVTLKFNQGGNGGRQTWSRTFSGRPIFDEKADREVLWGKADEEDWRRRYDDAVASLNQKPNSKYYSRRVDELETERRDAKKSANETVAADKVECESGGGDDLSITSAFTVDQLSEEQIVLTLTNIESTNSHYANTRFRTFLDILEQGAMLRTFTTGPIVHNSPITVLFHRQ